MSEATKRTYGLGSVYVHRGAWYGRWWSGGVRVKRSSARSASQAAARG